MLAPSARPSAVEQLDAVSTCPFAAGLPLEANTQTPPLADFAIHTNAPGAPTLTRRMELTSGREPAAGTPAGGLCQAGPTVSLACCADVTIARPDG
ncbi:MAG TPA: hypothetical protein VIG42_02465, partial [Solirubrobacteraceae bacterium]